MPDSDDQYIASQLRDSDNTKSERDLGSEKTYLLLLKKRSVSGKERHIIMNRSDIRNAFIIGHPVNGIIGVSPIGAGEPVIDYKIRVVNPDRKFIDNLYGTTFRDTASTNASWTGGGQIDFTTSGQTASSDIIYLNNDLVSTATLTPLDSGSFVYQLTNNGGYWETVSSEVPHSFSVTSTQMEYYTSGDTLNLNNLYGGTFYAQTFTIGTTGANVPFKIQSVRLKSFKIGNPKVINLAIRAVSGGLPTGANLSEGYIYGGEITTGSAPGLWYEFSMSPAILNSGTQYALTIQNTAGDASNNLNFRFATTPNNLYTGGQIVYSTNTGSNWATLSTLDMMFQINALPALQWRAISQDTGNSSISQIVVDY